MIVVKALKGQEGFLELTEQVFASVQLDEVRIVPPADINVDGAVNDKSITLAQWLQDLVRQAADVNLQAVGWVGLALIGYAALGLLIRYWLRCPD